MDVTVVTTGAGSADKLSEADYMDIFREIREKMSLRKFVEVIGSQYSIAWWGKYENGGVTLTRTGKGELRRAVGLEALPKTVTEVTGEVDPDATVWQVGDGQADRVVLVGRELHEPVTLRLNGTLRIEDERLKIEDYEPTAEPERAVTTVTTGRARRNIGRVCLRREVWERLNSARLRAGVSWEEFLGVLVGEG
jgi:hypothetical protein